MNDPRSSPAPDVTAEHLPCGRPAEPLLDLVLDGRAQPGHDERDEHQRACVHCRALAEEAARLWEPVRASAAQLEEPPTDLVEAVMAAVRALGRDPVHLVLPGVRGATRIAADVVRRMAERTAADVPGVAVALARHARVRGGADAPSAAGSEGGAGAVGLSGQVAVVDLAVVTVYGAPIPAVAEQVRAAVRDALAAQASATGVSVDIYVDDVVPGGGGTA